MGIWIGYLVIGVAAALFITTLVRPDMIRLMMEHDRREWYDALSPRKQQWVFIGLVALLFVVVILAWPVLALRYFNEGM